MIVYCLMIIKLRRITTKTQQNKYKSNDVIIKKTRFSFHDKCLLLVVKDFQRFDLNTINIFDEIENDFQTMNDNRRLKNFHKLNKTINFYC